MTTDQLNIAFPIDIIVDTDVHNSFDDRFAVNYVLSCTDKFNLLGVTAAPFMNETVKSPAHGMEESFYEVMKILTLNRLESFAGNVFMGATEFLSNDSTPKGSDAANFIVAEAQKHTPESPLYILALGPATNIASALLMDPSIAKTCVVVRYSGSNGFNISQDPCAANVISSRGVSLVEYNDTYAVTKQELEDRLYGKNPVAHYLASNAIALEQFDVLSAVHAASALLGISDRDAVAADLFARLGADCAKVDLTGYKLVFEDTFEGDSLDTDKWEPRRSGPSRCGFKGPDNSRVENGNLVLYYNYQENGPFGPGWYGSDLHIKKRYTRGYFECRCICNDTYPSNFWSAFWLQAHGPYTPEISQGGPGSAEIDIMEVLRKHLPSDPDGVRTGVPGAEANVHVTGMKKPPYTFPGHGTEHPFPIRFDLPDCYSQQEKSSARGSK